MNRIDLTPLYRSTVGYDRLSSLIDAAFQTEKTSNGYPPYNIEVIEENNYAITIAVAGFKESELDIQVENGVLTVQGKSADLQDGLLSVGLVKEIPEAMKPKSIAINTARDSLNTTEPAAKIVSHNEKVA